MGEKVVKISELPDGLRQLAELRRSEITEEYCKIATQRIQSAVGLFSNSFQTELSNEAGTEFVRPMPELDNQIIGVKGDSSNIPF